MMISFKGPQFPKDAILFAVFLRSLYWDLQEIRAEHGVEVDQDQASLGYQVLAADHSWRMDETYIRARDEWGYLGLLG